MTKQMAAMVQRYQAISAARGAYQAIWIRACEADRINPNDAKFVVFSDGNPFKSELDKAGIKYLDAIHANKPQNQEGVCS